MCVLEGVGRGSAGVCLHNAPVGMPVVHVVHVHVACGMWHVACAHAHMHVACACVACGMWHVHVACACA